MFPSVGFVVYTNSAQEVIIQEYAETKDVHVQKDSQFLILLVKKVMFSRLKKKNDISSYKFTPLFEMMIRFASAFIFLINISRPLRLFCIIHDNKNITSILLTASANS